MQTGHITPEEMPRTLMQAVRYFADAALCERFMRSLKWPDGKITCPACGASGDRIGEVATRNLLRCKDCRKMIYTKHGTIFEDSALPLGHWFTAIWAVANGDTVSSHALARALEINQRSAWKMQSRIRSAMILTHQ